MIVLGGGEKNTRVTFIHLYYLKGTILLAKCVKKNEFHWGEKRREKQQQSNVYCVNFAFLSSLNFVCFPFWVFFSPCPKKAHLVDKKLFSTQMY